MNDNDLLKKYEECAPDLSINIGGNTCSDCKFVEQDGDVDSCRKHTNMYHDLDMPENTNFVYRLICSDFCP